MKWFVFAAIAALCFGAQWPAVAQTAKLTCCQEAQAKKQECKHRCCIAAHKEKKSCIKCNPNQEDLKLGKDPKGPKK